LGCVNKHDVNKYDKGVTLFGNNMLPVNEDAILPYEISLFARQILIA